VKQIFTFGEALVKQKLKITELPRSAEAIASAASITKGFAFYNLPIPSLSSICKA
jgi:hypothetical protein